MAQLKIDLLLSGAKNASNELKKLQGDIKNIDPNAARAAQSLQKFQNNISKLDAGSPKQQLRMLREEASELLLSYRAMSDEMKKSDFGQAVSANLSQINLEAARVQDAMDDTSRQIRSLASDTFAFDAMKQGVQAFGAAAQAGVGIMQAFGMSSDTATQAISKMMTIQNTLNAVVQVGTLFQKESALVLGVQKVKALLLSASGTTKAAAAEGVMTAKTKLSTIAENAWNVAKAIGKALLGDFTGLVLVGVGAVATYAVATSGAKDSQEDLNDSLKDAGHDMETYTETLNSSLKQQITKYTELKLEWMGLRNEMERNEFIQKNQNYFDDLGISITTAADAERFFVNSTSKVVKAFTLRAKAAAAMSVATEAYTQILKAELDRAEYISKHTQHFKPGDKIPAGYEYNVYRNPTFAKGTERTRQVSTGFLGSYNTEKYTTYDTFAIPVTHTSLDVQKGIVTFSHTISHFSKVADNATAEFTKLTQESRSLLLSEFRPSSHGSSHSSNHSTSRSSGGRSTSVNRDYRPTKETSKELEAEAGSLKKVNDEISKLNNELESLTPGTEKYMNVLEQLNAKEKERAAIQKKIAVLNKDFDPETYYKVMKDAAAEAYNAAESEEDKLKYRQEYFALVREELDNNTKANNVEKTSLEYKQEELAILESELHLMKRGTAEYNEQLKKIKQLKEETIKLTEKRKEADFDELKNFAAMMEDMGIETEEFYTNLLQSIQTLINSTTGELNEQLRKFYEDWDKKHKNFVEKNTKKDFTEDAKELESSYPLTPGDNVRQLVMKTHKKGGFQPQAHAEEQLNRYNKTADERNQLNDWLKSNKELYNKAKANPEAPGSKDIIHTYEEAGKTIKRLDDQLADLKKSYYEAATWSQGFEAVKEFTNTISAIDGLTSSTEKLTKQLTSGANAWEIFKSSISLVLQTLETYNQVMTTVNAVTEIFKKVNAAKDASSEATAAAEAIKATGDAAKSAAKSEAQEAGAVAVKQGAKMPFPKNIAAIAISVGAVIAGLAAIKAATGAFADGGIVGGSSFVGDNLMARVNSGEMILNGKQQKRLFDIIDGGASTAAMKSGQVKFTIAGKELKGVLRNYDNKMGRLQ